MQINTKNLVSITEANQNFSKIAKLVDANGAAVILKNNVPRYVILEYNQFLDEELADTKTVEEVGEIIVKRYLSAFKELAK